MNEQYSSEHEKCNCPMCRSKCLSWGGIIAGALVAIGLSFLLSIFGAAIGLAAFHTTATGTTLAIGGYVGLIIGTFAVMFFAGWVAAFLSRKHCCHPKIGALYGFAAWCVALVITVLIAGQAMQFTSASLYTFTDRKVTSAVSARLFSDAYTPANTNTVVANGNAALDQAAVNDKTTDKLLSQALFLLFGMLFVGAIASALGGYSALACKCCCCSNKTCSSDKSCGSDKTCC